MSTPTLSVRAANGLKCPVMGAHRQYITDAALVDVPDNAHYRKLLHDGSLTQEPPEVKPVTAGGEESGMKNNEFTPASRPDQQALMEGDHVE